jgi:hypothetical protein
MSTSFWSKPRAPLLLGIAACAACCAAPLVAIIVGAGTATTLAAIFEPLAGGLLAAGAILAIAIVVRRRRQASASAATCTTDGACRCGPTARRDARTVLQTSAPRGDEPVACTADLQQETMIQWHMSEYRAAFAHLTRSERTADGFRWHFRPAPGLVERLRGLAEREHTCCSFMGFDIRDSGDELVWEGRAGKDAAGFLDEFVRMPERLREEERPGHDLVHLAKHARAAGLTFTSDTTR